jgi:hypothetical protein
MHPTVVGVHVPALRLQWWWWWWWITNSYNFTMSKFDTIHRHAIDNIVLACLAAQ